jgi:hypothetical protein
MFGGFPGVAGVGSLEGRVGAILAQRFLEKVVVAYLNPVVVRVNGVCVLAVPALREVAAGLLPVCRQCSGHSHDECNSEDQVSALH